MGLIENFNISNLNKVLDAQEALESSSSNSENDAF